MIIQFNLLPDIKIEYIKSQRTKRLVVLVSIIATGLSLALLILMFSYRTVQKQHLSNLNKDIASLRTELEGNTELSKILSVQNQLNTLPTLYDGRPAADRLPEYLDQVTPAGLGVTRVVVDFSMNTFEVGGVAGGLSAVNAYVDTLKFTTFSTGDDSTELPAFNSVVLTRFDRDDEGTNFVINFNFDPQIFAAAKNIKLTVPSTVTTRAQTVPSDLFNANVPAEEGGAGNAE